MMSKGLHILSTVTLLLYNSMVHKASLCFATNLESISSFFERLEGYSLLGHVIATCAGSQLECGLRCLRNKRCRSYNCLISKQACKLNGETRTSKPQNYRESKGWIYLELLQVANPRMVCRRSKTWSSQEKQCSCIVGYKGVNCQTRKLGHFSSNPGNSCKHIRDSEDSSGDGEYWIDPKKNGSPLKVFCDMTTDGGGWLLVANLVLPNLPADSDLSWTADDTYRGISNYSNNRMGINKSAMKQLSTYVSFTQMRFHCSKHQGRTFHVTTAANSSGEAVVQYFSGQTAERPASCGSFQRMDDDNSKMSVECDNWGRSGKWGHGNDRGEVRMYDHAAYVANKYHWVIVNDRWLCDDGGSQGNNIIPSNEGDFWKIYVR